MIFSHIISISGIILWIFKLKLGGLLYINAVAITNNFKRTHFFIVNVIFSKLELSIFFSLNIFRVIFYAAVTHRRPYIIYSYTFNGLLYVTVATAQS